MNQSIYSGILDKNPEVKELDNTRVANFVLKIDRKFKDKDGNPIVNKVKLTAYSKNVDRLENNYVEGDLINLQAHTEAKEYKNKNGETDMYNQIIVDSFLDKDNTKTIEESDEEKESVK